MHETYFRECILPLKEMLFRIALRITMNQQEAEDVVQETMLKIWDRREEWSRMNSVEAYCVTIAKNLAMDRIALKSSQTMQLADDYDYGASSASPFQKLVDSDNMNILSRLIEELSEKQREVLVMREVEGKSYKEIAAELKLTEEQVKVYLFRARQKIKQQFTDIENYGL